ncbi:MAG: hypothetical protein WC869_08170 [Phycisphaerae bacterium]|jgi:hypothetical protein
MANVFRQLEASVRDSQEDRLYRLISQQEVWYRDNMAPDDIVALTYFRGVFWAGDTGLIPGVTSAMANYASAQNEVFPIVDEVSAALASSLPKAVAKMRGRGGLRVPISAAEPEKVAARVIAPMNRFATDDKMYERLHAGVYHMLLFRKGAVFKGAWNAKRNRVQNRLLMPWEWFPAPWTRVMEDMPWCFERFTITWEQFRQRVEKGLYDRGSVGGVSPDVFPEAVVDPLMYDSNEINAWRQATEAEHVLLHEFHDFEHGEVLHYHLASRKILMRTPMITQRPYTQLILTPALGRLEGLPLVVLVAPTQRDINSLVSARRAWVDQVGVQRVWARESIFKDAAEKQRALDNPLAFVTGSMERALGQDVFVFPQLTTSPDFNKALVDEVEHIRHLSGGEGWRNVQNVRTAAEVGTMVAHEEGRMARASLRVAQAAIGMFEGNRDIWQWALKNGTAAGCNAAAVWQDCDTETDFWPWAREQMEARIDIGVEPFSPVMMNAMVRRAAIDGICSKAAAHPEYAAQVNWREVYRVDIEANDLPLSLQLSQAEAMARALRVANAEEKVAGAQPGGAPEPAGIPPALQAAAQPVPVPPMPEESIPTMPAGAV